MNIFNRTDQLPVGAQVRIAPGDQMIRINSTFEEGSGCFTEGGLFQDVPLLISVTDSQDAPLGEVPVSVYADLTANTFNGVDVLQLFADFNGNGVVDGPNELVTSSDSGVFTADTDEFDGTAFLILRMFLTCPYEGEVFAFSGAASTTMNVGVSFENTVRPTEGEDTDGGDTEGGDTEGVDITGGDTTGGDTTGGGTGGIVETTAGTTGLIDAGLTDDGLTGGLILLSSPNDGGNEGG